MKVKALNYRASERVRQIMRGMPVSGRQWYRHLIFAPGLQTGYKPVMFPGVDDALVQKRDISFINGQLRMLAMVIEEAAMSINTAGLCK